MFLVFCCSCSFRAVTFFCDGARVKLLLLDRFNSCFVQCFSASAGTARGRMFLGRDGQLVAASFWCHLFLPLPEEGGGERGGVPRRLCRWGFLRRICGQMGLDFVFYL